MPSIKLAFPDLQGKIHQQLASFFDKQQCCDMEFRGSLEPLKQPIRVHSVYLAIHSKVFEQAIENPSDFKLRAPDKFDVIHKSSDGRYFITIEDAKTSSLRSLFELLYKFRLDIPVEQTLLLKEILQLAKQLGFENFIQPLTKAIEKQFPAKNPILLLKDALQAGNERDIKICLENVQKELTITKNYQNLKPSIIQANLDLIKVLIRNQSPSKLSENINSLLIIDWITSNAKVRGKHTEELLDIIKGRSLSKDILQRLRTSRNFFGVGKMSLTDFLLDAYSDPSDDNSFSFDSFNLDSGFADSLVNINGSVNVNNSNRKSIDDFLFHNGYDESYMILLGGCEASGKKQAMVSVFDPRKAVFLGKQIASGAELSIPNLPAGTKQAVAVCQGNTIYLTGGYSYSEFGSPTNKVLMFKKGSNSWTEGPPMISARMNHSAVIFDSKIYVFGGLGPNHWRYSTMEILDIDLNDTRNKAWTKGTDMPASGVFGHSCVPSNVGFVVFGGTTSHGHTKQVFEFNANRKAWHELPSMSIARSHCQAAAMSENVYVCGGHDGRNFTNIVECLYRPQDFWAILEPMKFTRTGGVLLPYDQKTMYIFGGSRGGNNGNLRFVERFDADTNTWQIIQAQSPVERFGVTGCIF